MTRSEHEQEALEWQIGVWDSMSDCYADEIDGRFAAVVEALARHARLGDDESVLDLGTGTGALAEHASGSVGAGGDVVGVDISPEMLSAARARIESRGLTNVTLREGSGERIPADDNSFDVVVSSLAIMFMIDREAAAAEIARVLRPGGRFVAAVWAGADDCDIVRFQQIAGKFAGTPPVPGVGPGALGDPSPFMRILSDAGIEARVETETLAFDFPDFPSAWNVLAGVTTAHLEPDTRLQAQEAVMAAMYPDGNGPRRFENLTQFIIGRADA